MKIYIACDHNGVLIKDKLITYLKRINYEIIDLGTNTVESIDYPLKAFELGKKVSKEKNSLGILICGTGIGMSIACNKVNGIRCAKVSSVKEAELCKKHNNANVIAISGKISLRKAKNIISAFLSTPFSNEERHIRRNTQIDNYHD